MTEVELVDGVVTDGTATAPGSGPIPAGHHVLLGRDAGADALAGAAARRRGRRGVPAGAPTAAASRPRSAAATCWSRTAPVAELDRHRRRAPAHRGRLLRRRPQDAHAHRGRPAGRQPRRHPRPSWAVMMDELGAYTRSTSTAAAPPPCSPASPAATTVQVENSPSDGGERHVPNGLALTAPEGSGRLKGFWVETAMRPGAAPGAAPVARRPPRPGLPRAHPPAHRRRIRRDVRPGRPARRAGGGRRRSCTASIRDGMFRARRPAARTVTASARRAPRARSSSPSWTGWTGSAPPPTGSAWPAPDGHGRVRRRRLRRATATPRPSNRPTCTLDYDHDAVRRHPGPTDGQLHRQGASATTGGRADHRQGRQAEHRRAPSPSG